MVNVRFPAFHEGRGAGKIAHPGGHIIVSAKRIVRTNRSYEKKTVSEKEKIESSVCRRAEEIRCATLNWWFLSRLIRRSGSHGTGMKRWGLLP